MSATPYPTPFPTRRARPNRPWMSLASSLLVNGFLVYGVLVLGWPKGNVFLLFVAENLLTGLMTLAQMSMAGIGSRARNGRSNRGLLMAFFAMHYYIFGFGHLIFSGLIAYRLGVDLDFLSLGLPLIVMSVGLLMHFVAWLPDRERTSVGWLFTAPYRRVIVLHIAAIIGFGITMFGDESWSGMALNRLNLPISGATATVLLLIALKTISDILVAVRPVDMSTSRDLTLTINGREIGV